MKTYFVFAGEISGDLHGSRLIQALQNGQEPALITGVGGPRMRQEKFECFMQMEEFQVMGFSDVMRALPRLWKLFYQVRDLILKTNPDCVILIDYPGFNLRLAKAVRKQGFKGKLVQYICPTVWAHGKKRIEVLNTYYDLLLTIYPFEANYFTSTGLKIAYIGNPLVEMIQSHHYHNQWLTQMGLPADCELIALFPGSRVGEIQRHLPQQLKIAAKLKQHHPRLHFAVCCAQESLQAPLMQMIEQGPLHQDVHLIPPQYHYDLMKNCKTALAKSGTVTLELALHSTPTIVHYALSPFNYLFAKYLLRLSLPHYCIVNILGSRTIFPEFIGRDLSIDAIKDKLECIHFNPLEYRHIQNECKALKEQLGNKSSQLCAAQAIEELMKC